MQLQAKKIRHTLKAAGYDLFEIENFLFKYENFLEKTKQLVPQKQSLFRNYDADTVAANAQLRQLWLELPDAFDRVEEQALNEASAQQTIKACKHLFAN